MEDRQCWVQQHLEEEKKFRLEEQNFQQVSQASHRRNDDAGETSVGGETTSASLMNNHKSTSA